MTGHKKNKSSKSITIGYLVHQMLNDVSQEYFKGVYQAALDNDVNLIIAGIGAHYFTDFKESQDIGLNKFDLLNKNHFDGIIIWSSGLSYYYYKRRAEFYNFVKKFYPTPIVNIGLPLFDFPTVSTNNREGTEKIMEHLINDHKYKNFGFLRSSKDHFSSVERFDAYLNILKKNNLPINKESISPHCHFNEEGVKLGYNFFINQIKKGILKPGKNFDCIVAVSDFYAIPLIKELQKAGIRVPQDIAVTGFNNYFEGQFLLPELTSMDPNLFQVGYTAVKTVLDLIDNKKIENKLIYPPVKIIIRKSCGCSDVIDFKKISAKQKGIDEQNLKNTIDNIFSSHLNKKRNILCDDLSDFDELYIEKLLDKFQSDVTGYTEEEFLVYLNDLLNIPENKNDAYICLQKIISRLSGLQNFEYKDKKIRYWIYKLLYDGNNMIYRKINDLLMRDYRNFYSYADILRTININISKNFNKEDIFNELEGVLRKLNIPECYFFVFNKPGDYKSHSKIIFAYKDFKRLTLSETYYDTEKELISSKYFSESSRFILLFDTLIFKKMPLGYFLLNIKNIDNKFIGYIYEVLTSIISSSYYGAIIIDEMNNAQNEKEVFLNILGKQNIELEKAIKTAKKANKAKNDFLAIISHEIKTPLSVMIGLVEKILMVDDRDEQVKFGNLVIGESQKITQLLNQLLELSRMEADKLIIYNKPFSFLMLMNEINEAFSVIINNKGLEFNTNINFDINRYIIGDEMRLRQIITNLLSNAIKFTEQGEIQLKVDIKNRQKKSLLIMFQIIDTGIGIHKDMIDKIFELFTQAEGISGSRHEGSGLGTTIAKQLVELMGGQIGVDSTFGKGTAFWFTVPFKIGDELKN
ncbi:MAG: substrate-binding domain-containing protein [Spirochaetes bacterium]|nr:substrate-binding domain-containing protein [Spirochaetota bacterium]